MNLREIDYGSAALCVGDLKDLPQAEYRVTVTLAVSDASALWAAAAARAMAAPGTTIGDVLDTIGPREAPSISDCIAMLVAPAAIPGCTLDDFWIDSMPNLPSQADLLRASRHSRACAS